MSWMSSRVFQPVAHDSYLGCLMGRKERGDRSLSTLHPFISG